MSRERLSKYERRLKKAFEAAALDCGCVGVFEKGDRGHHSIRIMLPDESGTRMILPSTPDSEDTIVNQALPRVRRHLLKVLEGRNLT